MERSDQWVAARGVVCSVASTTAFTFSAAILGLRPGRLRSRIKPGTPACVKRSRHSSTVGRDVPNSCAMA
ncbi:hypothetical protein D3C83_37300 [compost metagenome]